MTTVIHSGPCATVARESRDWESYDAVVSQMGVESLRLALMGEARLRFNADERRRTIEGKLESGYSFCHPEEDCEGQKAMLQTASECDELRSRLSKVIGALDAEIERRQQIGHRNRAAVHFGFAERLEEIRGEGNPLPKVPLDQTTAPIDYEGRSPHQDGCPCEGCVPGQIDATVPR